MKQRIFEAPFSLVGRITRLEYIISILGWIGIDLLCNIFLTAPSVSIIYSIVGIVLFFFIICQGAKRCHDIGKSGWWQLIPFFFIWLMIAKGDDGENEYGESPL